MVEVLLEYVFPFVGILVGGEALALFIGILVIKKRNSPWNTPQNRSYLYADLMVGFDLLLHPLLGNEVWFVILSLLIVGGSIVLHFKRLGEYVLQKSNPFCANKALFVVNNLKLVLLFGLLFVLLPF